MPSARCVGSVRLLPVFVAWTRTSGDAAYFFSSSVVDRTSARCPRLVLPLRPRRLLAANDLRACRAAAPPPAREHRRAARPTSAYQDSLITPPTLSRHNLISAGL